MSNERKLSQTEFTDKVPLLNDNSQHDDSKTGKIIILLLLLPYFLVNVLNVTDIRDLYRENGDFYMRLEIFIAF